MKLLYYFLAVLELAGKNIGDKMRRTEMGKILMLEMFLQISNMPEKIIARETKNGKCELKGFYYFSSEIR